MKNIFIITVLLFSACSAPQQPAPRIISLMQVAEAFNVAKLPVTTAVVYDEKTDPNEILGRPGQYIEKMNFIDPRDKQKNPCSIEVFRNAEEAQNRKTYLDSIGKSASIFATYSYLHHNILVRVSFGVLPADADQYRQALESIATSPISP